MADNAILAPQTALGYGYFKVGHATPVTVYVYPVASLTASEYADLQRKDPDGTWQDVYDSGFKGSGGQVRLDTTCTGVVVNGYGEYRIMKELSTSAIGVGVGSE